jgi:hypothetical protein
VVTVSLTSQTYNVGETVVITGRVTDSSGLPVSDAIISIQVDDPSGEPSHINLVYSGLDGSYIDQFKIQDKAKLGTYKVYVIASKSGYADARSEATYVVVPEFPPGKTSAITALTFIAALLLASKLERLRKLKISPYVSDHSPSLHTLVSTLAFPVSSLQPTSLGL